MPYKNKDRQREFQRKWVSKRRQDWLLANGPCVKCGSWEELQVDHIDPSSKVDHRIWSWAAMRREIELKKCQVLCAACHLDKSMEDGTHTGQRCKWR